MAFCFAFSLIVFQILFFTIVITYGDLFLLKTGHFGARTVLSDSPVPIRNVFQKTSIAAAGRYEKSIVGRWLRLRPRMQDQRDHGSGIGPCSRFQRQAVIFTHASRLTPHASRLGFAFVRVCMINEITVQV